MNTLQSFKELRKWQKRNHENSSSEGFAAIQRHQRYEVVYTEYIYWMGHLASSQFFEEVPANLHQLTLADVEFILKVRTQILKNKQVAAKEREKERQRQELEKLKKLLK